MAASPLVRIEFEEPDVQPLEVRANTWIYARSRYLPSKWRYTTMWSVGDEVMPEGSTGRVCTIKAITRLPYKTSRRKK